MGLRTQGTPHYSDRLCFDRRYSDSPQSGRRMDDCSWIDLRELERRRTKSQKIRGSTIMSWMQAYVVTLPEEGAPPTPTRIPSPGPASLSAPRCLDQCRALHACNASTPSNFFPISAISGIFCLWLSVLKMYWVVLTGLSE